MIVYLDDSLLDEDFCSNEFSMAINEIFRSYRLGKHFVYASSGLIDKMCKFDFGFPTNSAINNLKSKFRFMGGVVDKFNFRLTIKRGDGCLRRIDENKKWEIGVLRLSDQELPDPVILAEDIKDANLYEIAAIHYLQLNDMMGYVAKSNVIKKQNGGGSNICNVLNGMLKYGMCMVLSICDSDVKEPGGASNSYSKSCRSLSIRDGKNISYHLTINSREIENILPFDMVVEAVRSRDNNLNVRRSIDKLCDYVDTIKDYWCYVDLKKGLRLFDIEKLHKDDFLRGLAAARGFPSSVSCASGVKCGKIDCECILLHPLSENILDVILDYLSGENRRKSANLCASSFNSAEWLSIGREVSDFCFSLGKMRS